MTPSAPVLDTGRRRLSCGPRPLVMGIINVTPDSFSDGGKHLDRAAAVECGLAMVRDGADILDVGGESSRPGAAPVPPDEERERVVPVIRALAERVPVPISVDTCKAEVADAALDAGAEIVNDITGLSAPAMVALVRRRGCAAVAMHMRGTPETMQKLPRSGDILSEVDSFFKSVLRLPLDPDKIALDPGIGFGKSVADNLILLKHLERFTAHGRPILVGASRKSFIGKTTGADACDRLPGSLASAVLAFWNGASVVRCHDVRETLPALKVAAAIRAGSEEGWTTLPRSGNI